MIESLYILGSGVLPELHFTVETIQVLKSCKAVFVIHNDARVVEKLRTFCPDIRTVFDLYEDSAVPRAEIYRKVAARVISQSRGLGRVALLVFGHPHFLVSACEYAAHLGLEAGFHVKIIPAISTFDTLLCDLGEDLGYGVQIYCAENLLVNNYRIDTRVPLVLFQLTQFMNPYLLNTPPSPEVFQPLVNHLQKFYPANHECKMVCSSTHVLEPAQVINLKLQELSTRPDLLMEWRPTLYIPVLQAKDEAKINS